MRPSFGWVTTWTLTSTPPDGPKTVAHGLSREQALWALTDLMYGTFEDDDATAVAERADERLAA